MSQAIAEPDTVWRLPAQSETTAAHEVDRIARGELIVSRVGGLSTATRALATSPLKLLVPRSRGKSVWAFTSTFGGGLVGGDEIELTVAATDGTAALLSTQASTKVYRNPGAAACRQRLTATIGEDALLVCAPDALTCFAGAIYEQRQRFDLTGNAGLVLVDSLTSGRHARGERWAFDRYHSRNDIYANGRHVYRDALLLDPAGGALDDPQRMGRFDCFATLVICGERLAAAAEGVLKFVAAQPVDHPGGLLFAASPLKSGVVVRVAGGGAESVTRWIRERLSFISELLGNDPWSRKH